MFSHALRDRGGERVQNPTVRSQGWQKNDNPCSSAGKPVREMSQRSSAGKPVRGIQNQLTRTKLDHHNLQISDDLYIENIFTNVRQKLHRSEDDQMLDQRVNVLIWDYLCEQRWKQRDILDNITMRIWFTIEWHFTPWMRSTLSHDKVIMWAKATDSFLSGKDAGAFRSQWSVERSALISPTVQRVPRINWNWWRTNWVRVEHFPRTHDIADSPGDSAQNCSLSNMYKRIWRSNHLHVCVQLHRMD